MVSSIFFCLLRRGAMPRAGSAEPVSNRDASCPAAAFLLVVLSLFVTAAPRAAHAQENISDGAQPAQKADEENRAASVGRFLGGAALALGAHEAGHLAFDLAFAADPALTRVDFHGIPFFAITPRAALPPRQRFTIASAGFWVQHGVSEWILTSRPHLRRERSPLRKGMLAFNVLASAAYAGAAFARTGPLERDTRGMAESARVDERTIGALILAPAALDTVRYFYPEARWAVWASRAAKVGLVLLVVR